MLGNMMHGAGAYAGNSFISYSFSNFDLGEEAWRLVEERIASGTPISFAAGQNKGAIHFEYRSELKSMRPNWNVLRDPRSFLRALFTLSELVSFESEDYYWCGQPPSINSPDLYWMDFNDLQERRISSDEFYDHALPWLGERGIDVHIRDSSPFRTMTRTVDAFYKGAACGYFGTAFGAAKAGLYNGEHTFTLPAFYGMIGTAFTMERGLLPAFWGGFALGAGAAGFEAMYGMLTEISPEI